MIGDKMRKFTQLQKILIGIITVLVVVTVFFTALRYTQPIQTAKEVGFDIVTTVRYGIIDRPTSSVFNWVDDYTHLWNVRNENDLLRQDIEAMAQLKSMLNESNSKIAELENLLELKQSTQQYEFVAANVTFRDLERWNDTIKLDVGKNDGVFENYAVITSKGLIGRVESVTDTSAVVRLIVSENGSNKVAVKIQVNEQTAVEAILEHYDSNEKAFVVTLLDTGYTIKKGDLVITSGAGGVFPSGLVIGTVSNVAELNNAVGVKIYVEPAANFNDFHYVFVVKRATP